jgi:hypothetical protein
MSIAASFPHLQASSNAVLPVLSFRSGSAPASNSNYKHWQQVRVDSRRNAMNIMKKAMYAANLVIYSRKALAGFRASEQTKNQEFEGI